MSRRVPSPVPGSPEWISLRRSGLGATDAAVVAGRSRYGTPFDKFAELQGRTAPKLATEAMRWGVILEEPVARAWAADNGVRVRSNGWTYFHPERRDIFSHYDVDVVPPKGEPVTEIVEVKTASAYAQREWGEEGTDQVPEEYALQGQHEMMCRPGIVRCHIAVLIGGQKLRHYVLDRDDQLIGHLFTIETAFLDRSWAGIPPVVDGSDACTAFLRERDSPDDGNLIELPPTTEELALAYLALMAEEKDVLARKAETGNRLRDAMGTASGGAGKEARVSFKQGKDVETVNWREVVRVLAADPTIIARHTTTKPGNRPLIVNWIGE